MGAPGVGHKGYVQLGEESTYGTAIAATHKLAVLNSDIKLEAPPIPDQLLGGTRWGRTVAQGTKRARGTISTHLTFDGLLAILRGAFGTYTQTTVETGVRDHLFKIGATLKSFTVQEILGDVSVGTCFRSTGMKIDKLTLRGTAGQGVESIVGMELGVLGQDRLSNQTPTGSLAFPPYFPVQFNAGMTTVDDGTADAAVDVRVRSFEFTLENMLTDDRFYGSGPAIDEPVPGDKLKATMKFQQEFQTRTEFDAYRALTVGSPKLIFQHPATIGSTSKREFEIRMNQAFLEEDPTPPLDGPGVLIANSTWVGFFDGVDGTEATPVAIRVRSTDAALS